MALAPFAPLSALGTDTGRLFEDFFGGGALSPWLGGGVLGSRAGAAGVAGALRPLYTDVVERENEYEMRVDVPGVSKENVTLEAEGQVLRLSVRQESESEDKSGDTWHRVERSSAFQTRALRFPDNADLSQVKADMDAGVLRVHIGKRAEAESEKRKQIKVA